jgi:4-diphosphocytidyl-2-C-methyl-D-erythritol kinase
LVLLNRLLGGPMKLRDLAVLGGRLGADVPFFVTGRPARAQGIGDELRPIPWARELNLVICKDQRSLSTREVYSRVDISLTKSFAETNISNFVRGRGRVRDLLVNDLEAAAVEIHPGILRLKERLLDLGAQGALMSGSGSAVFGVWPDHESAQRVADELRASGLWAQATQTLRVSPVLAG